MKDDKQMLADQVKSIRDTLENPPMCCRDCECEVDEEHTECPECESTDIEQMSGFDYLEDILDINFIINADRSFKGARVLVCFGGPNIWVDTTTDTIEGHWWGDEFSLSYKDNIGLHEACEDLYLCA